MKEKKVKNEREKKVEIEKKLSDQKVKAKKLTRLVLKLHS